MANLLDYYFRQLVSSDDLDTSFAALETADTARIADANIVGVYQGLVVGQKDPGPTNLSVDISAGVAYSKNGDRIGVLAEENLDCSVDENNVSTAVSAGGSSKVLSVFIEFERALSDPRVDGNGATVFFSRAESYTLVVRQGADNTTPSPGGEEAFIAANAPAIDPGAVLLADIIIDFGQTQIANADIFTFRRELALTFESSTHYSISVGTVLEALQEILQALDEHVDGAGVEHDAAAINYDSSSIPATWLNTDAATDVQAAIDGIVADLDDLDGADLVGFDSAPISASWTSTKASANVTDALVGINTDLVGTGGAGRVGINNAPIPAAWVTAKGSTTVQGVVEGLIADIVSTIGADLVGVDATAFPVAWVNTNASTSVQGSLEGIIDDLAAIGGAALVGFDGSGVGGAWANLAASVDVEEAFEDIVADLGAATGAALIGWNSPVAASWTDTNAAGSVAAGLLGITTDLSDSATAADGSSLIGVHAGSGDWVGSNLQAVLGEMGVRAANQSWSGQHTYADLRIADEASITDAGANDEAARETPLLDTTTTTVDTVSKFKLLYIIGSDNSTYVRLYIGNGGLALTKNAVWDEGTALWSRDSNTQISYKYEFNTSRGLDMIARAVASTHTWADGTAWYDSANGGTRRGFASIAAGTEATVDFDYVEGTFTPALVPGSGTITLNTSFDTMGYIKIGKLVTVTGLIIVGSVSAPTGTLTLTGLPFANAAILDTAEEVSVFIEMINPTGSPTGVLVGSLVSGSTSLVIKKVNDFVYSDPAANIQATTQLKMTFTYRSA